jgi:hypothetical protein
MGMLHTFGTRELCKFWSCNVNEGRYVGDLYKLFNLLLCLTQLFRNWHDNGIILKPTVSFHGGQEYIEVHPSQLATDGIVYFYQGVF